MAKDPCGEWADYNPYATLDESTPPAAASRSPLPLWPGWRPRHSLFAVCLLALLSQIMGVTLGLLLLSAAVYRLLLSGWNRARGYPWDARTLTVANLSLMEWSWMIIGIGLAHNLAHDQGLLGVLSGPFQGGPWFSLFTLAGIMAGPLVSSLGVAWLMRRDARHTALRFITWCSGAAACGFVLVGALIPTLTRISVARGDTAGWPSLSEVALGLGPRIATLGATAWAAASARRHLPEAMPGHKAW